jgi:hypothetical protein
LGYHLELETDHHSGRLRHPAGGPRLRHPGVLRLVPVDFEAGGSWRAPLAAAGFGAGKPAVLQGEHEIGGNLPRG